MTELRMSPLRKTWLVDLDGTILMHDGYLSDGDVLLPGAFEFMRKAYETGRVIILTARDEYYREQTVSFLKHAGIRYHDILFGMPMGERIVVNDKKPSGLQTAFAMNLERNKGVNFEIVIDEDL